MNRLIIVGSPRVNGRCASLAELLFEACIEDYPEDEVALAPVSTLDIAPCDGCGACAHAIEEDGEKTYACCADDDDVEEDGEKMYACCIEDDMNDIYELMDTADELTVVCPVYFSGVPSQMKALIDRLQPYWYAKAYKQELRPLTLHVVGEGGDPFGYLSLVREVQDAFYTAGFELVSVRDWVGKISAEGEIQADATEFTVDDLFGGSGAEE